jgi:hypothetical protein
MKQLLLLTVPAVAFATACVADPDLDDVGTDASVGSDQPWLTAPGALGVTLGVNAPLVATRRPTIEFRPTGGATSFHCRFDNEAFVPCTSSWFHVSPRDLADGWHTFQVYVRNGSSQSEPARWLFRIDATPPVVTFTGGPSVVYRPMMDPLFAWKTSEPVVQTYYRFDSFDRPWSAWQSTPAGAQHFWIPDEWMAEGFRRTIRFQVGVRDEAGNWGYATWTFVLATFF